MEILEGLRWFMDALAMSIGYTVMLVIFISGLVYLDWKFLLWALRNGD